MYEYRAVVRSVYDGDTFRANVDLGFNAWVNNIAFRFNRINAPELVKNDPAGRDSRDFLLTMMPVGATIIINTDKDKTEKYGRWLAEVFSPTYGNVNDLLVQFGFAKYWNGVGARPV